MSISRFGCSSDEDNIFYRGMPHAASASSMIGSSSGKPKDMVIISASHSSVAYSIAYVDLSISIVIFRIRIHSETSYLGDNTGIEILTFRDALNKHIRIR